MTEPDSLHEQIARVCHEAILAWSGVIGEETQRQSWEDSPDWHRASYVVGVKKALGGATSEELHESWCQTKLTEGWQHGEQKDAVAKTHPCLVPYGQLPSAQRKKDALFAAITRVLGCGVERWAVKTGTDPDAPNVNLSPELSSIAELAALPAPPPDPPARVPGGAEFQVYSISATVTACKQEADSDYHLALADGAGNTMIAEAACPGCAAGSPWLPQIQAVRAAVEAAIPDVTESYQDVNRSATITGVGFFDRIHGQRGVAPNGIELHPVLAIEFV